MPVKVAEGQTVVEVRRTRVASTSTSNNREKRPDFWDYVEALNPADWASKEYRYVIERGAKELKSDQRIWVAEIYDKLMPADIAKQWGGGTYTIWFKGPPKANQILYKEQIIIEGGTKSDAHTGLPTNGTGASQSNDPLLRLVDVMDRRLASMEAKLDAASGSGAASKDVEQAVQLTGQVFSAATTAATGTLNSIAGGNRPAVEDDIEREFKRAMIQRMLNPPDEIAKFAAMITAFKGIMPELGGAAHAGSPLTQLAIEGMKALPTMIQEGVKGLEQWKLGEEARARQAAILRGQGAPINITPQAAAPPPVAGAPPAPPPVAAAPPPENPSGVVQVSIEQIELGIRNILLNPSLTIDESAHRVAALMEDLNPGMPDQVAAAGEDQILRLFQTRPILQSVPQNPRLTEFIKKFIEVVKTAPVIQPAPPAGTPPA